MIVLGRKPGGAGGGGAPSGAAGGALAGTYPNPTLAALTWTSLVPDLINGAAAFGGGYSDPAYAISQGLLFLRGAVNPGTDGEIIQLPAPAIPSDPRIVSGFADGTIQPCEITAAGIIDFFANPGTSAFLDGIYVSL